MPNWCSNFLSVTGPADKVYALHDRISKDSFFNSIIPIPDDKIDDWYNWNIGNWGTKWDADPNYIDIEENSNNEAILQIGFESAWAPPVPIAERLTEQGFNVELHYHEPGMGFVGLYTSANGDECYEYGSMSSKEIQDQIPAVIDEFWQLAVEREEYEKESRDELTAWYEDGVVEKGLKPHNPDDFFDEFNNK